MSVSSIPCTLDLVLNRSLISLKSPAPAFFVWRSGVASSLLLLFAPSSCQCGISFSRLPVTGTTTGIMWARRSWMARGFKIFLLLLLIHTFAHQQFPFLPVLAFTHRIPIPYYLSILSIYHRLLLWKQSETSLDSSIQLPRKYIISYTHSIAISLIHHSNSSHFLFFFLCTRPAGFRIQKFCVYTYIHYITHRRAVDSLLIPFPPSFSFLLFRLSSFSILEYY